MSTNPAEAYTERLKREREENPVQIDHLDDTVLAGECRLYGFALMVLTFVALPEGIEIISIVPSGVSAWCKTFRIDVRLKDGEIKPYFMKVSLQ